MSIQHSIRGLFNQLEQAIVQMTDVQYCAPVPALSGASIGQHVRHVLDLFICLQNGLETGFVNYENRQRNPAIEQSVQMAIAAIDSIVSRLNNANRDLVLEAGPYGDAGGNQLLMTSYLRELLYNLEHTVHHMALLRIAFESAHAITLPMSFGVASSTIRYRQAQLNG
jgi:hypothetical protein